MEVKKLEELKEYDVNDKIRTISHTGFDRLKSDLTRDGQLDNLLIMPDGTVLGGNHRLKAMKELGWETAKCDVVDFVEEDEGWIAVLNGEPLRSHFHKTKEAAMLYYSIKDNNGYAVYNQGELMNFVSQFDINLDEVRVYFDEPINLEAKILDPSEEWKDMPEFSQDDLSAWKNLIVNFKSEKDLNDFSRLIGQDLTSKTKSIWYPKQEKENLIDKAYVNE